MWWYLSDLARFKHERVGLETLASDAEWLTPLGWRTDDAKRLIFDADIQIGTKTFSIYLSYPAHFPHTPPSVYPRGEKTLWSDHQFGPGGELCLEYGPDNWTSDITGAQLLESAHRLLLVENSPTGNREILPSRHDVSIGQALRTKHFRLLITRSLKTTFGEIKVGEKLKANMLANYRPESNVVYIIDKITKPDGEIWHNPDVPTTLGNETFERKVPILRIAVNDALPTSSSVPAFKVATAVLGFDADETTVVILRGEEVFCFVALIDSVIECAAIPPEPEVLRLDDAHSTLRTKSVALIGCGSLGSKIATMLARAGINDFYLVDDDVLFPDNMVRHDLDWRDVGVHKADAVAQRIRHVNPSAKVYVRRIRIAGQEASGSAETALASLVRRDLIVDATANANVYNLVAAIAETAEKPMVWAQVFGGGFGGLIGRYRPNIEPSPQLMRRAIDNWFREKGYEPKLTTRDYATGGDGPTLIADDADVTSIAAPTARMIIDTLIGRTPSFFPSSVYVVGLAREAGLFTQAFETYPIDVPAAATEPKAELSADDAASEFVEIVKIFAQ